MALLLNEGLKVERGGGGCSDFHVMKGNPFGAEANSLQQPAVLEDS